MLPGRGPQSSPPGPAQTAQPALRVRLSAGHSADPSVQQVPERPRRPVQRSAAIAAGGAGQMAVYSAYDPRILRELGYTKVAGYGMAAEALGSYAYQNVVKPMMA